MLIFCINILPIHKTIYSAVLSSLVPYKVFDILPAGRARRWQYELIAAAACVCRISPLESNSIPIMVGAAEGDKYNLALVSVVYNQVTQPELARCKYFSG